MYRVISIFLLAFFTLSCEEECPPGYYGENCEDKEYDVFLGNYSGSVNCGAGNQLITLLIIPEPQNPPYNVLIDLEESSSLDGFKVKARVLKDTLFVDDQILKILQGTDTTRFYFYASHGVLSNDTTLNMQLILSNDVNPGFKIECNYNLIKR